MADKHPDHLDPENCARCAGWARHLPVAHGSARTEGESPSRDIDRLIGAHWNDPQIPPAQLDRWDAMAVAAWAAAGRPLAFDT